MSADKCQNITLLGATGSIGDSTLEIIARHPRRFNVVAISGHKNVKKLAAIAIKFKVKYVVISHLDYYTELCKLLASTSIEVLAGTKALSEICQLAEIDSVVAGIVGSAGMQPVIATVEAGKNLLLANKESLVVAGSLVMDAARDNNAIIIPLDSEHNAIYQCLPSNYQVGHTPKNIEKIILTASGGPFWDTKTSLNNITPQQACAHPNWDMGRKISVDSATLMNKGLEIIEAHWLFNLTADKIDVHVHPQSIIHSMVCYKDGSVLAQLGEADMRIPIAYGLGLRTRISSGAKMIDLLQANNLQFFPPDFEKFPCLKLAQQAIQTGGTAAAILNTANEVTVDAFLNNRIAFTAIAAINQEVMRCIAAQAVQSVAQLLDLDTEVRMVTQQMVKKHV